MALRKVSTSFFHTHNPSIFQFSLSRATLKFQGQEKQARRNNMYSKFLEMKRGTLLTTGLAERGWDIPRVHWIIQYDPPHKPEVCYHFNSQNFFIGFESFPLNFIIKYSGAPSFTLN